MASIRIGDALSSFLKSARWQDKIYEIRLQNEWERIMGKTIARYTQEVKLKEGVLIIATQVAPLKQELQMGKQNIMANINEYFNDKVVKEIIIR